MEYRNADVVNIAQTYSEIVEAKSFLEKIRGSPIPEKNAKLKITSSISKVIQRYNLMVPEEIRNMLPLKVSELESLIERIEKEK